MRYFCPDSCLDLAPERPRDTGLQTFVPPVTSRDSLAPVDVETDEEDECPSVKYFCTPSCENVAVEIPRDTGRRYFVGAPSALPPPPPEQSDDAIRYFVAVDTDRVPVERPRETGEREFGPPEIALVGAYNLSDERTETGCVYYSGEPCIDVVTADRSARPPPPPEKYFCPGVCAHLPPEAPRDTGLAYFAPPTPSASSVGDDESSADVDDAEPYAFNLSDVRHKTGYLYFRGRAMHQGYPPVRYFCPGSCESLEPEPERDTGTEYFGVAAPARRSSLVGFQANLSDVRTETGCRYFGVGEPCVEVRGWDRVPRCLKWSCTQVAGWIESLGFSYYRVSRLWQPVTEQI